MKLDGWLGLAIAVTAIGCAHASSPARAAGATSTTELASAELAVPKKPSTTPEGEAPRVGKAQRSTAPSTAIPAQDEPLDERPNEKLDEKAPRREDGRSGNSFSGYK